MTIILISNSRGTLVNDLYAHLLGKGKNVKLAYIIPKQKSFWNKYRLLRGLYFLGCLLGLLRFYKADIFHVHYISPNIVRTLSILKFMCRKLIWTLWGSDFRVTSNRSLHIRNAERIKSKVDVITSTSNAMAKDYKGALGVDDVKVIRFGLSVFQTIDAIQKPDIDKFKRKHGINSDSRIVVCGSSAAIYHAHDKIIDAISGNKNFKFDDCTFIFPLTYGSVEVREKTVHALADFPYQSIALTDFMPIEDLAVLRKLTDILINVPTHDQMLGAMIESVYAGAHTITGGWLKYDEFEAIAGEHFHKTESYDEIPRVLRNVLDTHGSTSGEEDKIREDVNEFCGWDHQIDKWLDLYK